MVQIPEKVELWLNHRENSLKIVWENFQKMRKEELVTNILNSLLSSTHIKWTFFEDLISTKKLKLHESHS